MVLLVLHGGVVGGVGVGGGGLGLDAAEEGLWGWTCVWGGGVCVWGGGRWV